MHRKREPKQCVGIAGVAAWLGVDATTVSQWHVRYPGELPPPDFTAPARGIRATVDRYWLDTAERKQEWLDWKASRPSQGRPGVPKGPRSKEDADVAR
jgi:hypothetical protein